MRREMAVEFVKEGEDVVAIRLGQLRRVRSWTQEDLADRAGVSQSQVSAWEGGRRRPDIDSVRKLARAFEMSQEQFAREIGYIEAEPEGPVPATPLDEFLSEIERRLKQDPALAEHLARNKAENPEDYPALLQNTARVLGILAGSLLEPPP